MAGQNCKQKKIWEMWNETYPVVDCKSGELEGDGNQVDHAVEHGGLELLLQIGELGRPVDWKTLET